MKILNWLLPAKDQNSKVATLLLAARVIFALLLASHGLQKLQGFESLSASFPDPLGIGSQLSLSMAIFGELVCSTAVIFGFLTRLAIIPMAFTMTVAFFITHGGSLAEGELAFAYLAVFVLLFFAGPGKYSIDGLLAGKFLK
ncbi:MAG: DoxX family protein [Prevotella sp.]|nr:DoxX family protein [Prevotella sp.]